MGNFTQYAIDYSYYKRRYYPIEFNDKDCDIDIWLNWWLSRRTYTIDTVTTSQELYFNNFDIFQQRYWEFIDINPEYTKNINIQKLFDKFQQNNYRNESFFQNELDDINFDNSLYLNQNNNIIDTDEVLLQEIINFDSNKTDKQPNILIGLPEDNTPVIELTLDSNKTDKQPRILYALPEVNTPVIDKVVESNPVINSVVETVTEDIKNVVNSVEDLILDNNKSNNSTILQSNINNTETINTETLKIKPLIEILNLTYSPTDALNDYILNDMFYITEEQYKSSFKYKIPANQNIPNYEQVVRIQGAEVIEGGVVATAAAVGAVAVTFGLISKEDRDRYLNELREGLSGEIQVPDPNQQYAVDMFDFYDPNYPSDFRSRLDKMIEDYEKENNITKKNDPNFKPGLFIDTLNQKYMISQEEERKSCLFDTKVSRASDYFTSFSDKFNINVSRLQQLPGNSEVVDCIYDVAYKGTVLLDFNLKDFFWWVTKATQPGGLFIYYPKLGLDVSPIIRIVSKTEYEAYVKRKAVSPFKGKFMESYYDLEDISCYMLKAFNNFICTNLWNIRNDIFLNTNHFESFLFDAMSYFNEIDFDNDYWIGHKFPGFLSPLSFLFTRAYPKTWIFNRKDDEKIKFYLVQVGYDGINQYYSFKYFINTYVFSSIFTNTGELTPHAKTLGLLFSENLPIVRHKKFEYCSRIIPDVIKDFSEIGEQGYWASLWTTFDDTVFHNNFINSIRLLKNTVPINSMKDISSPSGVYKNFDYKEWRLTYYLHKTTLTVKIFAHLNANKINRDFSKSLINPDSLLFQANEIRKRLKQPAINTAGYDIFMKNNPDRSKPEILTLEKYSWLYNQNIPRDVMEEENKITEEIKENLSILHSKNVKDVQSLNNVQRGFYVEAYLDTMGREYINIQDDDGDIFQIGTGINDGVLKDLGSVKKAIDIGTSENQPSFIDKKISKWLSSYNTEDDKPRSKDDYDDFEILDGSDKGPPLGQLSLAKPRGDMNLIAEGKFEETKILRSPIIVKYFMEIKEKYSEAVGTTNSYVEELKKNAEEIKESMNNALTFVQDSSNLLRDSIQSNLDLINSNAPDAQRRLDNIPLTYMEWIKEQYKYAQGLII